MGSNYLRLLRFSKGQDAGHMNQDLMRIGISIPGNLLGRFDDIIDQRGYSSRSEGIREAIRGYIQYDEWMSEVHGDRIAVITIVYGRDRRKLINNLKRVQHENSGMTLSTFHKYIDAENCVEVMAVRGDGGKISDFAEKMMALKGVKHVKLTTIMPDSMF